MGDTLVSFFQIFFRSEGEKEITDGGGRITLILMKEGMHDAGVAEL